MTYHSDGDLPILISWLMTNHQHIKHINLGILKHERTNRQTLKTCWRTFIEVKVRNDIWNQQLPASCELNAAFERPPYRDHLQACFFAMTNLKTISPYPLATPSKMLVSPVLAVFLQEQPNQVHSVCIRLLFVEWSKNGYLEVIPAILKTCSFVVWVLHCRFTNSRHHKCLRITTMTMPQRWVVTG